MTIKNRKIFRAPQGVKELSEPFIKCAKSLFSRTAAVFALKDVWLAAALFVFFQAGNWKSISKKLTLHVYTININRTQTCCRHFPISLTPILGDKLE